MAKELIPIEAIAARILVLRGQKVLLDSDLARLYGVETKNLILAVKRNLDRFPEDFMYPLTPQEDERLPLAGQGLAGDAAGL